MTKISCHNSIFHNRAFVLQAVINQNVLHCMLHNYLVISVFPYFSDLNTKSKKKNVTIFFILSNLELDRHKPKARPRINQLKFIKSHISTKHLRIKQHNTIKQYKYDQISHKIAHTHIMCGI